MCEKPKDSDSPELESKNSGKRSYYYDDAHGYEDYDPDEDEKDDESDESA